MCSPSLNFFKLERFILGERVPYGGSILQLRATGVLYAVSLTFCFFLLF